VTGPVERFAGQIASQGYVVGERHCDCSDQLLDLIEEKKACPSVYHEFEGPDPIPYDVEGMVHSLTGEGLPHDSGIAGTDRGNNYKVGARRN